MKSLLLGLSAFLLFGLGGSAVIGFIVDLNECPEALETVLFGIISATMLPLSRIAYSVSGLGGSEPERAGASVAF